MKAETQALDAEQRLDDAKGIACAAEARITSLEEDLDLAKRATALHKIGRVWQHGRVTKKAEQEAIQASNSPYTEKQAD